MPDVIDILTPQLSGDSFFTVNNAVDYVTTSLPALSHNCINAIGKSALLKGDSFQLLSMGVIIPEAFTLWKSPLIIGNPLLTMVLNPIGVTSGVTYVYPNFGASNSFVPMENYECMIDTFFDCKLATAGPGNSLLLENYYLELYADFINISMQAVPSSLNGKVFQCVPFMKIAHTFPMV